MYFHNERENAGPDSQSEHIWWLMLQLYGPEFWTAKLKKKKRFQIHIAKRYLNDLVYSIKVPFTSLFFPGVFSSQPHNVVYF